MRFQDKIVVVTGAGSGIGAATARRFSQEGATVVLVGRTQSKLTAVAADLDSARTHVVAGDIGTEEGIATILSAVEGLGGLDVLVNNAGIAVMGTIEDISVEDWRRQIDVNLTGTFMMTKAAWPHLKARKGNIVNVSSVSGLGGDWEMLAYNASKGGISNFTRALALDAAKAGVRVNAVNPSFTKTGLTEDMLDNKDLVAKFAERMPLGAPADPSDIASAILFLASDDARFVTGVNLPVDGGLMASNGQPAQ
ncbi:SDR family NAD(P)-dependent oxidoreductase [Falsirhodobacter halotolerans]|uniref:SDR family NAD(P)-dependent oxidoreductase n=1 Tax=Falsirhodobacter halotolerans TaxID=1146892 RepID=UPI001FD1D6A6|nr:SDR family oxidoreductase [Falsirhodobacter halotolerans]MCJ8139392.1 SDR family oxidoreductase [Falsirhodobacter halotolerans]